MAKSAIAYMYETGTGVRLMENHRKSWMIEAAKAGYAEAQFNYALKLFGVTRLTGLDNFIDSLYLFKMAAQQNHPRAKLVYDALKNEDFEQYRTKDIQHFIEKEHNSKV